MAVQSKSPNVANLADEREKIVGLSPTTIALRRLRRDKLTLIALGFFLLLTVLSVLAPVIERDILHTSYSSVNLQPDQQFQPFFTPGHVLGTDDLGRDHFARLLYGGQVSIGIAFFSAILSLIIGVSLGVITGFYGGIIDDFVNWVIATLSSIPSLFLLLIVSAFILNNPEFRESILSGPMGLILILGLLGWTGTTRLVRGETLTLREREYIVSARALGASPFRIMFVHILPNLISIVVITLAIDIGALILTEAALSFLGLGVKEPIPSWGNMLFKSKDYLRLGPHLIIMPGALIFITVLCLYVIGDGIRDAFDPTAKDN